LKKQKSQTQEGPAMNRPLKVAAAAALMLCLMAGATYAATRTIPENQAQVTIQNTTSVALPGDAQALEQTLKATKSNTRSTA
jgi:hypothetical protein